MNVNTANNSKHSYIVLATNSIVYSTKNMAATLAKSRAWINLNSAKAELKSISTQILSQDRASTYSGTVYSKATNLSQRN